MHMQTQFSVFLVNKPGVLAQVTAALAKAKVNIMALTLVDSMEHGVLRLVCHDAAAARKVLGQAHDRWTETDVLVMELENRPGSFSHVAERLAEEHINISYAYSTGGGQGGKTTAVFKVADMKKAAALMEQMEKAGHKEPRALKTPRSRKAK
ncbi:MAG: ACT domain-containing protein [Planctomycetaceae bacterium]|nr:ACT domain-containing protein [Planctomycetaceae bacterium]